MTVSPVFCRGLILCTEIVDNAYLQIFTENYVVCAPLNLREHMALYKFYFD